MRFKNVNCIFERKIHAYFEIHLAPLVEAPIESSHILSFYPRSMSYVVASKVKEMVNGKGMMSAGDLAEQLSKTVEMWLDRGVKAAQANDRKTVRGSDVLVFAPGKMSLVVVSKVKEFVNAKGMMSSGDLGDFVSGLAEWLLAEAVKRAAANGRKTVRGEDL